MMRTIDDKNKSLKLHKQQRLRRRRRARGLDRTYVVIQTIAFLLGVFFVSNIQIMLFKLEMVKCEANKKLVPTSRVQVLDTLDQSMHLTNRRLESIDTRTLPGKPLRQAVRSSLNEAATDKHFTNSKGEDTKLRDELNKIDVEIGEVSRNVLAPRTMSSTNNPIYFMHIGKTGGSSVNGMLKALGRQKKFRSKFYLSNGQNHFDWSWILMDRCDNKERHGKTISKRKLLRGTAAEKQVETVGECHDNVEEITDIVTWLRHPVSRAISQFYYSKKLSTRWNWAKRENPRWAHETMEEYMNDDISHQKFIQPLTDGEGGTKYLAGTWNNNDWLSTDGDQNSDTKVYLRQNKTAAVLLAAKRLDQTTWFGLLEEKERSLKLLQLTMGLDELPKLPHTNAAKIGTNPQPSDATKKHIEEYLPQDMWLYEYAQRLFEARWSYFTEAKGIYVQPQLPPLPDFSQTPPLHVGFVVGHATAEA